MWHRKTLKVALNATSLNLEKLLSRTFNSSEGEIVGAATLKVLDKSIPAKQIERAGSLISNYLEVKTGTLIHSCKKAGIFVFGIGAEENLLSFIRELQLRFIGYDECDYMKLEIRFQ